MLKFIIYAIIGSLVLISVFYAFQRQLIYYPVHGDINPKNWGLPQVKLITLKTQDGVTLSAWYNPARSESMPTILYFHGNYGHLGYRAPIIKPFIQAGYGVLLISYRGYSGSGGRPTEQGLYEDGRTAIHYLISQGIKENCIVLYGVSLGSGIVINTALNFPVGAMVLQSSFTSLIDVGKKHYPLLPINLLLKDRYESDKKIASLTMPKLFIHGLQDTIIPHDLGKRLYQKAASPKQFHSYSHAGHNNLPDSSQLIIQFLKTHKICQSD